MAREDGERIDEDGISFGSVKPDLLCRTVFPAQEAGPGCQRGCIDLGARRHNARGVELYLEVHAVEVEFLGLDSLEGLEIASGHWPRGKLGVYELLDFHFFEALSFLRADTSHVRIRSL